MLSCFRLVHEFVGRIIGFSGGRLLVIGSLVLPVCPTLATQGAEGFLRKHCAECHGKEQPEGGLDLVRVSTDINDTKQEPIWVRIHDRVAKREMPPREAAQPTETERTDFLKTLHDRLHAAAMARQQSDGRVLLRRMNRREYETTLHDLLGIAEPLQRLLPEDNAVHGFDTVSRGLETSATHLLRYQQAADVAITAALPRAPVVSTVRRWTGREYLAGRLPVHRTGIDPFVRVEGEALVLHARLYGDNSMQAPHPPVPGRYRIRASVRSLNINGKPLSVLIGKRVDRFQTEKLMHIVDIQNLQPSDTRVLEVETDLGYSQGNQFIFFEGLDLPWFEDFEKQRGDQGKKPLPSDFVGPGLAIDWAELEGPLDAELGTRRMFHDLPRLPNMPEGRKLPDNWKSWPSNGGEFQNYPLVAKSENPSADANRLIRAFLPLAFRRPVTEAQGAHYSKIVQDQLAAGEPFDDAMRTGYKAILSSPWFLYYVEQPGKLDDFAVAARLARFLWNSMPDAELSAVAASGTLTQPAVLRAQTERMLKDPKTERFARSFIDQWLDLGKFLDMKPDEIYVEYDDMLAWSMPLETRRFFHEVLANDLPTSSFVQTDWTFLNSRLAKHYGIPDIGGLELRKVALPPDAHRGGVITHGSILKLTTNSSYTSPVKRGTWILERIIGKPPSPPPPNVKAVEPDIRGATTIREQLDKHKNVAVCASCHVHIDPPGFALENFDIVGGWRDRYRVKQGGEKGTDYVELVHFPSRKAWFAKTVQADGTTGDDIGRHAEADERLDQQSKQMAGPDASGSANGLNASHRAGYQRTQFGERSRSSDSTSRRVASRQRPSEDRTVVAIRRPRVRNVQPVPWQARGDARERLNAARPHASALHE